MSNTISARNNGAVTVSIASCLPSASPFFINESNIEKPLVGTLIRVEVEFEVEVVDVVVENSALFSFEMSRGAADVIVAVVNVLEVVIAAVGDDENVDVGFDRMDARCW